MAISQQHVCFPHRRELARRKVYEGIIPVKEVDHFIGRRQISKYVLA